MRCVGWVVEHIEDLLACADAAAGYGVAAGEGVGDVGEAEEGGVASVC